MPFFGGGGGGGGDYTIESAGNVDGTGVGLGAIIGDNNMRLGVDTLAAATNVDSTVAVGNLAGNKLDTPSANNVVIGYSANPDGIIATQSVFVGANILSSVSSESDNDVFIGYDSRTEGFSNLSSNNTVIGASAYLYGSPGIDGYTNNVVVGAKSRSTSNGVIVGYNCFGQNDSILIGRNLTQVTDGEIVLGYEDIPSEFYGVKINPSTREFIASANTSAIVINDSVFQAYNQNYNALNISDTNITVGTANATSIVIGGIDFSGGPGGGSVEGVDAFKITAISTTSTFGFYGAGVTTVGTLGSLTLSNTNVFRKVPMVSAASAAGAGSGCGIYSTQPTNMFPSATSLSGGFKFNCVVSIDDASGAIGDAGRNFFGLSENVGALTNSNPSGGFGGSNTLGIGSDAGDSTLSIIVYDGIGGLLQKTSLGADFPVSAFGVPALWEIELTYDVNPITVSYKVTRKTNTNKYMTTGVTVPINTPLVAARPYVWRNNGAVASAVRLNINSCSLKII